MPTSFYRFEGKERKEPRPTYIMNLIGEVTAAHTAHIQVFVADDVVGLYEFAGFLVMEIQALTGNFAVQFRNPFHRFPSAVTALVWFASYRALGYSQFSSGSSRVFGIVHHFTVR